MKQVTRYEAEDGRLFDNESDCIKYEHKIDLIKQLETDLYLRDTTAEEIVDWMIEKGYLK